MKTYLRLQLNRYLQSNKGLDKMLNGNQLLNMNSTPSDGTALTPKRSQKYYPPQMSASG
jgi:hypothetical protein